MKVHTEYLTFNTKKHREYIHITPQVESALRKSGIQEGMILVSAMHITAGVYVNDNESGLIHDIDKWLEEIAPYRDDYQHHGTGETNGDSHLKSMLVHHEVIVPVTGGKLDLGPWQAIFYAEFDGQRPKRLIIKVMANEFAKKTKTAPAGAAPHPNNPGLSGLVISTVAQHALALGDGRPVSEFL